MINPPHRAPHSRRRSVGATRVTRPRIARRWLVVSGLLVTILAVAATIAMLTTYPPPQELTIVDRVVEPVGFDAVLLDTAANRDFFASIGADHSKHLTHWTRQLEDLGVRSRTISSLADWNDEPLVLPYVYCLSAGDLSLLSERIDSGAGVLIAGPLGVREPNGEWAGWDRMHRLIGSVDIVEVPEDETDFMIVDAQGPLANLELSGHRIRMQYRERQWAIAGLPSAAYWAGFDREPASEPVEAHAAAAIAHRRHGRIAWVGYDPGLVGEDPVNREAGLRLLRGFLLWCSSEPISAVDLWPSGREAAMIVVEDTETKFQNAGLLAKILDSRGIQGGFMCVSDLGLDHPDLIRSISRRHDIGSHSDDHGRFAGQSKREQSKRLKRSANALSALSGRPVLGLRPPEEAYDPLTLKSMAENGYRYLLGDVNLPNALPEIIELEGREGREASIVVIPRGQADDYDLAVLRDLDDKGIIEALLQNTKTSLRTRGVDFVSLHTHILGTPERVDLIGRFLEEAPLDRFWVSGPDRLADWWSDRRAIATEIVESASGRFALRVVNGTGSTIDGPVVWFQLPGNPDRIEIGEGRWRLSGPDPRGAYRVSFDRLNPHETIEIPLNIKGEMALAILGDALDRRIERAHPTSQPTGRRW